MLPRPVDEDHAPSAPPARQPYPLGLPGLPPGRFTLAQLSGHAHPGSRCSLHDRPGATPNLAPATAPWLWIMTIPLWWRRHALVGCRLVRTKLILLEISRRIRA